MPAVGANRLTIEQTGQLDPALTRALRAIYEDSFPPAEREDFSGIEQDVQAGSRQLFVARMAGDPVGLAVLLPLDGLDVGYLEYMAVAAHRRNQGIGSRLLAHVASQLRGDGAYTALAFEVEPVEHRSPAEAALRQRRIDFYRRHGAVTVPCAPHYRGPNLAGPGEIRFTLMWLPLGEDASPPRGERLRTLVRALLTQGYGLAPDHPLVVAVLADLACALNLNGAFAQTLY